MKWLINFFWGLEDPQDDFDKKKYKKCEHALYALGMFIVCSWLVVIAFAIQGLIGILIGLTAGIIGLVAFVHMMDTWP